ncbi:hypothetical protein BS47DRAFT_1308086 [Hydnum rufescens UP504]|uniref:DUF6570 domain-containing protein n=1 Tax=Hydnum rufescens UP504 TaxID=1448309 RepID=A0A9P6AFN5_9AGAM|nr:hypothetical protein BS47DRAFT_1308086 [Hydnum rufescens UP504]
MLLEELGLHVVDGATHARVCAECLWALQQNEVPMFSLVNRMWIGAIPPVLDVLMIPEQLLILPVYTCCFMFKLHPKCWNVTSFPMNPSDIGDMLHGNMMPQPTLVLPSLITVTFVGLGALLKSWLKSTFRVWCHTILLALQWLLLHNPYFVAYCVDDETVRIKLTFASA